MGLPRGTRDKNSLKNLSKNKNASQTPLPLASSQQNMYSDLESDMDLNDDNQSTMSSSTTSRRKLIASRKQKSDQIISNKPPPITIVGLDYASILVQLKTVKEIKNNYELKLAPNGIAVYTLSTDDYKKVKQHLQWQRIKFFTHALREEQMSKFVLHGFYNTDEADVMENITTTGITPVKVKKMTIKNKKFQDHCTYIVYFMKKDNLKIANLREIKALQNVRVRWEFYQNRRQGPIQCSNCLLFGHGGLNCGLNPRCIRCGENHKSIDCPLIIDESTMSTRTRVADENLKCANCGQRHTANYSKCQVRLEIINRQAKFRSKTQSKQRRPQNFVEVPKFNTTNYPRLDTSPVNNIQPISNNSRPTIRDALVNNSDLLTPQEITQIFNEMLSKLRTAKTKFDQINIIGEIVIKYAYPAF
jgi:hypothetical protein